MEIRVNGSVTYLSSKYEYYLTYEVVSQDITLNQTTLRVKAYARKKSTYSSYTNGGTSQIQIDGQNFTKETGLLIDLQTNQDPQLIGTARTKVITHNADGTKTITIRGGEAVAVGSGILGVNDSSYSPYKGTATGTFALPAIPREATLSDVSLAFTIGNDLPITVVNAGALYVQVVTKIDGTTVKTEQLGAVSGAQTLDLSTVASTIYALVPNAVSIAGQLVVQTFTDGTYTTQVGVDKTYTITANVDPTTNKPVFTFFGGTAVDKTINVVDSYGNALVTSHTNTLTGSAVKIIKGYNTIRAIITSANKMVAQNSATPDYYSAVAGALQASADYSTSDVNIDIQNAIVNSLQVTAYDSRGLATTLGTAFTNFANYTPINITSVALARDNDIDAPTTLTVNGLAFYGYFGGGASGVANTVTMHYRYKATTVAWGAQVWNAITATFNTDGTFEFTDYVDGDLGAGGFDADIAFDIEVRAFDKLSAQIKSGVLSVGTPLLHKVKEGMAIKQRFDTGVNAVLQMAGDLARNGVLLQDDLDTIVDYAIGGWFPIGLTATPRVQTYTNDPASGSNIVLNMTDTSGFQVGDKVWVWSSAGNEVATITVVTTNTSITVNALALNHTTTGRAVYLATTNLSFRVDMSADATNFIRVGDKLRATKDGVTKYAIVTKVSGTIVFLYGGTDYHFTGTGTLTDICVARTKNPVGFPIDPDKWTIKVTDVTQRNQATPAQNTWYNLGGWSALVPLGMWDLSYSCITRVDDTSATQVIAFTTLSKANNTEDDTDFTTFGKIQGASATMVLEYTAQMRKIVTLTALSSFYINIRSTVAGMGNFYQQNAQTPAFIKAVCAYL